MAGSRFFITYRALRKFLAYCFIGAILFATLFSRWLGVYPFSISHEVNLHPYIFYPGYLRYASAFDIVGNVIMFLPVPWSIRQLTKIRDKRAMVAIACLFSIAIEVSQHLFGIGSADINDVIMNTLGAWLGLFAVREG